MLLRMCAYGTLARNANLRNHRRSNTSGLSGRSDMLKPFKRPPASARLAWAHWDRRHRHRCIVWSPMARIRFRCCLLGGLRNGNDWALKGPTSGLQS